MTEKILKALEGVREVGVTVDSKPTKMGEVYHFGDDRYDVKVTLEYPEWIGLEFRMSKSKVEYSIDTDLYKLDDSSNQAFIDTIESEITTFLENLRNGLIKVAYIKNRPIVLIPQTPDYILIKQGLLITSQTVLQNPHKVLSRYDFVSFPLKIADTPISHAINES